MRKDLATRFARHVSSRRLFADGERVLVALSGGLDSTVLLHLLRFAPGLPRLDVVAAHLDHDMRPESSADAHWVRGLCAAWRVPLATDRAEHRLRSEDDARRARYAFLARVREESCARWVVTAHHADDQAETVLFRILRGTGVGGLAGVPDRGPDGLVRPLLPFWREQILRYARDRRISWREDGSNADPRFARNAIRGQLLPQAEALVAAGARRSLVRLARVAGREEAAWASLVAPCLDALLIESSEDRLVLRRDALLAHPVALRARVLREAARRLGSGLSEAGTREGLVFTSRRASGRRIHLSGGLNLARELDVIVLSRGLARVEEGEDEFLEIGAPSHGRGTLTLAGASWEATWSPSDSGVGPWSHGFASSTVAFPLRIRAWRPGDRIRLSYGTKKLKKLLVEARIPSEQRHQRPVVSDASGRVIWVPGVERAAAELHPDAMAGGRIMLNVRGLGP
jgi:tRNA(Ile)-lysidine synthase